MTVQTEPNDSTVALLQALPLVDELTKQVAEEFGDRDIVAGTSVLVTFTSKIGLQGTRVANGPHQAAQEKLMLEQKYGLRKPQFTASENNLILREERKHVR